MCKPIPPISAQRDREIRRMQAAAKNPGVIEFASMVADAVRLARRINQWTTENPAHVSTATNRALKIAMGPSVVVDDVVTDAHRILSSMGWTLETSTAALTSEMLSQVFPQFD